MKVIRWASVATSSNQCFPRFHTTTPRPGTRSRTLGDLFEPPFEPRWSFLKMPLIAAVGRRFDYKHERRGELGSERKVGRHRRRGDLHPAKHRVLMHGTVIEPGLATGADAYGCCGRMARSPVRETGRNRQSSRLFANRRWLLRRCRMILLVLSQDRLEGFLWPKFRSADFVQTGRVPI
jgi:hypothetical protein